MSNIERRPEVDKRVPFMDRTEMAVVGATVLGVTLAGFGFLQWGDTQKDAIRSSLNEDAEQSIEGFDQIIEGGDSPQTILEEIKNATVVLEDGTVCDFQYTTDGGFLGFEDHGTIVDPGTCPEL